MASVSGAEQYFAERLKTTAWDNASAGDKTKAIAQAERELGPYKDRVDTSMLDYAIYEQALWRLKDDTRAQLQQAGVGSVSLGQGGRVAEQFNLGGRDPNIAPGAWAYLRGPSTKVGGLR